MYQALRHSWRSRLICSGEITREAALDEIEKDPYSDEALKEQDREFVIKKLGLTEFEEIMALPIRRYEDYPNRRRLMDRLFDLYSKRYHRAA